MIQCVFYSVIDIVVVVGLCCVLKPSPAVNQCSVCILSVIRIMKVMYYSNVYHAQA